MNSVIALWSGTMRRSAGFSLNYEVAVPVMIKVAEFVQIPIEEQYRDNAWRQIHDQLKEMCK